MMRKDLRDWFLAQVEAGVLGDAEVDNLRCGPDRRVVYCSIDLDHALFDVVLTVKVDYDGTAEDAAVALWTILGEEGGD